MTERFINGGYPIDYYVKNIKRSLVDAFEQRGIADVASLCRERGKNGLAWVTNIYGTGMVVLRKLEDLCDEYEAQGGTTPAGGADWEQREYDLALELYRKLLDERKDDAPRANAENALDMARAFISVMKGRGV